MSTARSTMEQQAEAYEQHLRENWDRLPAWEQEQAQRYFDWRDQNPRALVEHAPVVPASGSKRDSSWAVKAGYLCAAGAFLLSPLVFTPVGVLLGIFNIVRGRYGHGIAQVVLTVSCAALAIVLTAVMLDWLVVLQDRLVDLQSTRRR